MSFLNNTLMLITLLVAAFTANSQAYNYGNSVRKPRLLQSVNLLVADFEIRSEN